MLLSFHVLIPCSENAITIGSAAARDEEDNKVQKKNFPAYRNLPYKMVRLFISFIVVDNSLNIIKEAVFK